MAWCTIHIFFILKSSVYDLVFSITVKNKFIYHLHCWTSISMDVVLLTFKITQNFRCGWTPRSRLIHCYTVSRSSENILCQWKSSARGKNTSPNALKFSIHFVKIVLQTHTKLNSKRRLIPILAPRYINMYLLNGF